MTKPVDSSTGRLQFILKRTIERYQKVADAFVEQPTLKRLGNLNAFTVQIERRLTDLYLLDPSDDIKRRIRSYAESLRQVCAKEAELTASIDEGKRKVANDLFENIRRRLIVVSSLNRDHAPKGRSQQMVSAQ